MNEQEELERARLHFEDNLADVVHIADLERQLAKAQARLRKANCDYGDGWLSDDLECGVDVEPWCGKHAVLYYIRINKEAQGKLKELTRLTYDLHQRSGHPDPACLRCQFYRILSKEGE